MLMRMLNSLIERTPVLAARRTVKTKWYIINRYNESHDDTMDENAVMLFLCDEQRGDPHGGAAGLREREESGSTQQFFSQRV